ncbi:hypothetical protein B4589_017265 (plasmid) [Halolamina sp. CBA1230]|uniref:hypothetical protein n=1 Tax=Halolamina sp. CBA1230 TaxID=1853690 RepID=UPI00117BD127|nr:hypothetical protein [Halolamina sp. CBA1230]QKY22154.1 hypothetical protein B4589_017265 [Halolamina sp. CBA1230]
MGTATRGQSGASNAGYEDAKRELADAVGDKDAARTSEIYFKMILAAQPNGAAKVPAYLAVRYGSEFIIKSHQNGVESATKDVGTSVTKEVVAAGASEAVVEQASKEAATRGLAEGSQGTDRAFSESAERAMESAMGDIMTEGADALERHQNSK